MTTVCLKCSPWLLAGWTGSTSHCKAWVNISADLCSGLVFKDTLRRAASSLLVVKQQTAVWAHHLSVLSSLAYYLYGLVQRLCPAGLTMTGPLCSFLCLLVCHFRHAWLSTRHAPPSPQHPEFPLTRLLPWTRWTAFCALTQTASKWRPQQKEPVEVIPTQRYTALCLYGPVLL